MGLEPLRPSNLIRVMPAKEVRSDVLPGIGCITHFGSYDDETIAVLEAVVREGVDAVQSGRRAFPTGSLLRSPGRS